MSVLTDSNEIHLIVHFFHGSNSFLYTASC